MRSWIAALFLSFLTLACSTLETSKAPKEFTLTRRWTRSTISEDYLGYRRLNRMKPILTENLVIEGNAIDGLKAFDRDTGRMRWSFYVKDGVEAGAQLLDGVLYFGASDGQFYAVDALNGQVLWSYPIGGEGLGEPTVREGRVFFLGGNNVVHALAANTGKLLWTYSRQDVSQLSIRGGSRPSLEGTTLYVGFTDGYLVALNRDNGAVLWETLLNQNKRFRDVDAHPVILKDRIFVPSFDGGLYCLDKTTGKILWNREEGGYSAVTPYGSGLYYGTNSGEVLAVDQESGKKLWGFKTKGLPTQPEIYKGLVLVGDSQGPMYALNARSGQEVGRFHPGRGVTSKATVDSEKGEVYFMSIDANLFALKMDWIATWRRWPWERPGEHQ